MYEVGDVVRVPVTFTTNNTRGTITRESAALKVESLTGYQSGDTLIVRGAGPGSSDLIAAIISIAVPTKTVTLDTAADTTATNVDVGEATDPSAVTAAVTAPSGAVTDFSGGSVTQDGTGRYHIEYATTEDGVHGYRFVGTGSAAGVVQGVFDVAPTGFSDLSARALCTPEEVKQFLGHVTYDYDEANFIRAVNDSSAQIHRESGREFVARNALRNPLTGVVTVDPEARYFDIDDIVYDGRHLWVGDMRHTTGLAVTSRPTESGVETAVTITDVTVIPRGREPWEPIRSLRFPTVVTLTSGYVLEVTATWGFPQIPDDIRVAAIKLAAGSILRDVWRVRNQNLEPDFLNDEPRTLIGTALGVARSYKISSPFVSLQIA